VCPATVDPSVDHSVFLICRFDSGIRVLLFYFQKVELQICCTQKTRGKEAQEARKRTKTENRHPVLNMIKEEGMEHTDVHARGSFMRGNES